jgi:hypothetical protein
MFGRPIQPRQSILNFLYETHSRTHLPDDRFVSVTLLCGRDIDGNYPTGQMVKNFGLL